MYLGDGSLCYLLCGTGLGTNVQRAFARHGEEVER
jgi:hypothetical protein